MQKETLAIIDCGTNTFHLLIAELDESDDFVIREKYKEPVKLGEGGINSGRITEAAFKRGIRALKGFRKLINSKKANQVLPIATSAIRSASNRDEFVKAAKVEAGIDIKVINGNEEASLIFEGVKNGVLLPVPTNSLIVDIGGGSVEFIVVRDNKPLLLRSLDIGAARLLEIIQPSDPITPKQITETREHLREKMSGLLKELKEFEIPLIVGSSGSFETLASMVAHVKRDLLASDNLNSYRFPTEAFGQIHAKLIKKNKAGRLKIPGMDPMRVGMIVMASLLIEILVEELGNGEIMISNNALKEGILYNYIHEKKNRLNFLLGNTDRNLRAKAVRNLAKKYHFVQDHCLKVSELASKLFDKLHLLHRYGETERELLKYSALLHDMGHYVNRSGHHKHGQYIIMHSALPGFSSDELLILGNIVRYHRKSVPTRDHFHFKILRQPHRTMVRTLAGLLRIADNLDRGHRNLVQDLRVTIDKYTLQIDVLAPENIDLEIESAIKNKGLLESVAERKVVIRQVMTV